MLPRRLSPAKDKAPPVALGPPDFPPRCNGALPRPPVHAEALGYSDDLRPVRSFVASRARYAGLPPPRIPDLVIAISELAANSVRHSSESSPPICRR